jgi:hypothetical protein
VTGKPDLSRQAGSGPLSVKRFLGRADEDVEDAVRLGLLDATDGGGEIVGFEREELLADDLATMLAAEAAESWPKL